MTDVKALIERLRKIYFMHGDVLGVSTPAEIDALHQEAADALEAMEKERENFLTYGQGGANFNESQLIDKSVCLEAELAEERRKREEAEHESSLFRAAGNEWKANYEAAFRKVLEAADRMAAHIKNRVADEFYGSDWEWLDAHITQYDALREKLK